MDFRKRRIRIIHHGKQSAAFNMACDEYVFTTVCKRCPEDLIVRLYAFNPEAMTIGFSQLIRRDQSLQQSIMAHHDVTRRITGGGRVIHDDDVPYTCIFHESFDARLTTVSDSYVSFHTIMQSALSNYDIACELYAIPRSSFHGTGRCFTNPVTSDLMYENKKIAGAAQKRTKGWVLHQGSIEVQTLIKAKKIDRIGFIKEVVSSFSRFFDVPVYDEDLSPDEIRFIERLMRTKYMSREWILRR